MKTYYVKLLDLHKDCFYSGENDLIGKIYEVRGSFYYPIQNKYGYYFYKPKVKLILNYKELV